MKINRSVGGALVGVAILVVCVSVASRAAEDDRIAAWSDKTALHDRSLLLRSPAQGAGTSCEGET